MELWGSLQTHFKLEILFCIFFLLFCPTYRNSGFLSVIFFVRKLTEKISSTLQMAESSPVSVSCEKLLEYSHLQRIDEIEF